jgi:hypothetical protein
MIKTIQRYFAGRNIALKLFSIVPTKFLFQVLVGPGWKISSFVVEQVCSLRHDERASSGY